MNLQFLTPRKTLLFAFVLCTFALVEPAAASSNNSICSKIISKLKIPAVHTTEYLKNFWRGNLDAKKIAWLGKKDARLAWLAVSEKSKTATSVDNFTSAASQQFVLTTNKFSKELKDQIKALNELPTILSDYFKLLGSEIDPTLRFILDNFEKRFRLAAAVLNTTAPLANRELEINDSHYLKALAAMAHKMLVELKSNGLSSDIISDSHLEHLNFENLKKFAEANDSMISTHYGSLLLDKKHIKQSFLNKLRSFEATELEDLISAFDSYFAGSLENMPVGISYRVLEFVSTVRLGDYHFFGGLGTASSTDRAAHEKNAANLGGVIEAELNISTAKKKRLATMLSRGMKEKHQTDRFFSLEKSCFTSLHFGTCGSSASMFLISNGVPVIAPAYLSPTPALVSLGLQRLLFLPTVKKFRVSDLSKLSIASLYAIALHDGVIGYYEIGLYLYVLEQGFLKVIPLF